MKNIEKIWEKSLKKKVRKWIKEYSELLGLQGLSAKFYIADIDGAIAQTFYLKYMNYFELALHEQYVEMDEFMQELIIIHELIHVLFNKYECYAELSETAINILSELIYKLKHKDENVDIIEKYSGCLRWYYEKFAGVTDV